VRSHALGSAAARVALLRIALLAVLVVLAVRAGHLATGNPDAISQGANQIHTRITLPGARGLILDRSERELAISVDAPSVYVFARLVDDVEGTARTLAGVLDTDARALARRISAHEGFTYLERWIEPAQAERIRSLALPGVGIEREPRRTYPASTMASPLIGFADIDGRGVRGVEQMMDAWLQGRPRTLAVERDATGRLLSSGTVDPRVTAGGDIALTLDAGLQAQAEAALAEAVAEADARGGLVICVDPATGDILSLAEAPGFDPNDFRNVPYASTRSRAFLDALEPGSTMKAFLVAAALEADAVAQDTRIDTGDGWVRVPGKTIRDHHPYGVIDPTGVLRFSSNVGAVWIAERLGAERYHAALLRFGFSQATGSGFPHESNGLLRDWHGWRPVDQATMAFGQGMNVTPIQLAMATAAIANDGVMMEPRLIGARRPPMGDWETLPPRSAGRALSAETARTVRGMLESVIGPEGTGRLAGLAGVRVAGKTGTAQLLDDDGSYSQTRYTAWFVGMAPAEAPRVAIVVALDEPRGRAHTGGAVAAPLFAQVAASQLAHHGIVTRPEPVAPAQNPSWVAVQERIDARRRAEAARAAESTPRVASAEPRERAARAAVSAAPPAPAATPKARPASATRPGAETRPAATVPPASPPPGWETEPGGSQPAHLRTVLVPDFRGSSLDRAKRLAASESLDVRIHGSARGRVVGQSPAAGTIIGGSDRTVILSFAAGHEEG
jgi:cell division protein FtsI (penicillin-binding protein 3)